MKKFSYSFFAIISIYACITNSIFAELVPTVNNLNAMIENNTNLNWRMGGIRFRNEGFEWIGLDNGYPSVEITNKPIGLKNEVTIIMPNGSSTYYSKISPGNKITFNHKWSSTMDGSDLDPEFIPEVLVKTGTSGSIDKPLSANSITLEELESLMITSDYYNSNYRYNYTDSLGVNGGKYAGGFLDTWYNLKNDAPETQIQIAIPADTFTINNFGINIDTSSTMGPLYWMALAMGQEYFDVDLQLLMTVGIKEGSAGVKKQFTNNDVFYDSTKNHASGIGPWEVEPITALDRALGYPHFFPKYNTELSSALDLSTSGIDVYDFSDYYCGASTHINSAKIVNTMFFYIIVQYVNNDVLTNCTDVCWKEALEVAVDPYMGFAAMLIIYNLGNSQVANVAGKLNVNSYEATCADPNARTAFGTGYNKYVPNILNGAQNFINASKLAKDDSSVEILDYQISKRELLNAFFGDNGTVSSQGPGGLLLHFLDPSATSCNTSRQRVWDNLIQAFDLVKGKAPSTIGTDKISFRYDLLSIYRTVKDFIVFERGMLCGGDATNISIPSNSGNYPSCFDSIIENDNTYPYLVIDSQKVEGDINLNLSVFDNNVVKSVKWTTDSSWIYWHEAKKISETDKSHNYLINVPNTLKDENGNTIIWIMATDESGNSTVKKEIVDEKVETFKLNNPKLSNVDLKITNDKIKLNFNNVSLNELISVDLYSLNGKKVRSLKSFSKVRKSINIPIDMLNSGIYVLKLTGRNYIYDYKINVLR